MADWYDDIWLELSSYAAEDFAKFHREVFSCAPNVFWDSSEIEYFFMAFTLWAAQTKHLPKVGVAAFDERATTYRKHVKECLADMEFGEYDYDLYVMREIEYMSLLVKGSKNFFKSIIMSPFKPVTNLFVSYACIDTFYRREDVVKVVQRWLIQKGMELDRALSFS
ncbi:hypothetical protein [Desulfoluna spongiiphila]|uniref:hypothetical protein n=1 Tax=Desulfoluna spongiiphila TaxID=419481 RepID=UPI00125AF562|nr:hypothetical protein [Desulfoluna spongiiphila]VVS90768.1 hypothetical protein DBB_3360 [Desulfoluna spongiiphila]